MLFRSRNNGWILWLALALGIGALVAFLLWRFPDAIYDEQDQVHLVRLLLVLVLVASSILAGRRLRLRGVAKAAALWAGIIVVLALGFLASLSPAWRASRYQPVEAITKV